MHRESPVVLLVDDHEDSTAMYAIGLLAMGFQPVTSETAEDAFARACEIRPDVVVADVTLTGASGVELTRRLRADRRTAHAGIIVLTGHAVGSTRQKATDAGCDRFLLKLDTDARDSLSPVAVELRARALLHEPGLPGLYTYFPVSAVISIVSTMENGASAEVAIVGREGMVGLASVLGTVESPTTAVVQIAGTALRTPDRLATMTVDPGCGWRRQRCAHSLKRPGSDTACARVSKSGVRLIGRQTIFPLSSYRMTVRCVTRAYFSSAGLHTSTLNGDASTALYPWPGRSVLLRGNRWRSGARDSRP